MNFSTLASLLGQRIDSEPVTKFANEHGVKLPLKPSTDGSYKHYFSLKKLGLEVSWHHIIHHPDFYPPTKENRKNVCYIDAIWFDCQKVSDLPFGLTPQSNADEIAKSTSITPKKDPIDEDRAIFKIPLETHPQAILWITVNIKSGAPAKLRWSVFLKAHNQYSFLKSGVHSHAFTPWHPNWPPEQNDLPIGMFMAWCIDRGYTGERHLNEHLPLVEAVKARALTGREFLYQTAYCNEFWSWDISPDIHSFAHTYIHCLCHRNSTQPLIGRAGRCGPEDDFMAVFNPFFENGGLDAADDWVNYVRFALLLDARLYDYEITNLETDIDESLLAKVHNNYAQAQSEMALLPPPVALSNLGNTVSAPVTLPKDLTQKLMGYLGATTDSGPFQEFITSLGLEIPAIPGSASIDAPHAGFFIGLTYPWYASERIKSQVDEATKKQMQRKKIKLIEEIEFTNSGATFISGTTGNSLAGQRYGQALPFSLSFDDTLPSYDARYGPDDFEEHTWDTYENDETLTRRWRIDFNGNNYEGEGDQPHLLLLVAFKKGAVDSVRLVIF